MSTTETTRRHERRLDRFVDRNCICATCVHAIDRDLFGNIYCDREDSMAGGWNPGTSCCEEHAFRNPELAERMRVLQDAWYAEAESAGDFDLPDL
jgi:hypothetical protein